MRGPAAVDGQGGAGDRGGGVRAEEGGKGADLLGLDELLGRLRREHHLVDHLVLGDAARLRGIRDLLLDQGRQDVAGADGVCRDAVLRTFEGQDLGEAEHAVLGGHVSGLER